MTPGNNVVGYSDYTWFQEYRVTVKTTSCMGSKLLANMHGHSSRREGSHRIIGE